MCVCNGRLGWLRVLVVAALDDHADDDDDDDAGNSRGSSSYGGGSVHCVCQLSALNVRAKAKIE